MKELGSKNQMTLKYSNFSNINQYLFPKVCQVNLTYDTPNGPIVTSVNIQHNRAEIAEKELKFPFNIPTKYVQK